MNRSPSIDQPPSSDAPRVESPVSAWEHIAFTFARGFVAAMTRLIGLGGLYTFGRCFGTLEWLINARRRRRFRRVLAGVLGRKPTRAERVREGRAHFARTRCDKLFYMLLDLLPSERLRELLTIQNRHLLEEARAAGRGMYVALSHIGPHHVGGVLLALQGYKVAGVRDPHEGALRRFMTRRIQEKPGIAEFRVLYTDTYPRELIRTLEAGFVLGSAMDVSRVRDEHLRTQEVAFLGEKRQFLTGPLRVALMCKATILQGFVFSEPGFRYRLELVDLLPDDPGGASEDGRHRHEAQIAGIMERYASHLEDRLRAHPSAVSRI